MTLYFLKLDWDKTKTIDNYNWPNFGRIDFQNYEMKYKENQEPVLTDLNILIEGGEKIGICGRTGINLFIQLNRF